MVEWSSFYVYVRVLGDVPRAPRSPKRGQYKACLDSSLDLFPLIFPGGHLGLKVSSMRSARSTALQFNVFTSLVLIFILKCSSSPNDQLQIKEI